MVFFNKFPKEPCGCCTKSIKIGQSTIECEFCDSMVHSKCISGSYGFAQIMQKWACPSCQQNIVPRYNPFSNWSVNESDKNYDEDCSNDALIASNILNQCNSFTISSLNKHISTLKGTNDIPSNDLFSSFFLNIDGNKTNFDHFITLLKSISHQFSAIGIAETNIGPDSSSLYMIPD